MKLFLFKHIQHQNLFYYIIYLGPQNTKINSLLRILRTKWLSRGFSPCLGVESEPPASRVRVNDTENFTTRPVWIYFLSLASCYMYSVRSDFACNLLAPHCVCLHATPFPRGLSQIHSVVESAHLLEEYKREHSVGTYPQEVGHEPLPQCQDSFLLYHFAQNVECSSELGLTINLFHVLNPGKRGKRYNIQARFPETAQTCRLATIAKKSFTRCKNYTRN